MDLTVLNLILNCINGIYFFLSSRIKVELPSDLFIKTRDYLLKFILEEISVWQESNLDFLVWNKTQFFLYKKLILIGLIFSILFDIHLLHEPGETRTVVKYSKIQHWPIKYPAPLGRIIKVKRIKQRGKFQ